MWVSAFRVHLQLQSSIYHWICRVVVVQPRKGIVHKCLPQKGIQTIYLRQIVLILSLRKVRRQSSIGDQRMITNKVCYRFFPAHFSLVHRHAQILYQMVYQYLNINLLLLDRSISSNSTHMYRISETHSNRNVLKITQVKELGG